MNIRYYLLIGFAIFELGIRRCRGHYPIVPITPYPIAVNPCPNSQTACCGNQQLAPCSEPPTNGVSCQQCQSSTTCACSTIQTNPIQTCSSCCSTTQCCGSTTQCCGSTTQCCGSTNQCCGSTTQCCSSTTQCCSSTTQCCGSTIQCCGSTTQCCCGKEPPKIPTPAPPTPPTPPPPPTISTATTPPIVCPPGTILIGLVCTIIYCPPGTQMVKGNCVVIECPKGTVWIGHRCGVPEPTVQNITIYNTIITQFNQTKPDIIINNTNNIVVNASVSLNHESNQDISNTTKPSKCCVIMTPRICEDRNNRWQCYSRRSRRCGTFCVAPKVYLRPPRILVRRKYIVMPPIQYDCELYGHCGPHIGGYDCSGCAIHHMEHCSQYCYSYSCSSSRCAFYDQMDYCAHQPGSYGCQEEDGCYEGWCGTTM
ncbi:uncharacterized protein LOC135948952 [Calliphora vicina]|uniref:uncharacterized protein LOC135948952 n=1 Tax=Calliphora vicina TaxID=7373 RepID=UPI00325B53BC